MTILHNVPLSDYLGSSRVGSSKLNDFRSMGARGYFLRHVYQSNRAPRTVAKDVGTAFESALAGNPIHVFPPEDLKVAVNGALSTKEAKAWKAEQEAEGKVVLSRAEFGELFEYGVSNVRNNMTAVALMEASEEQVTLHGWDDVEGFPGIQSRPDFLCLAGCSATSWRPSAPDLKTCKSLEDFERSIYTYGYHRQAALVDLCLAEEGMRVGSVSHPLIAVEKRFPYRCQVFELSSRYMELGMKEVTASLRDLIEHYRSDEWPMIAEDVVTVHPKPWHMPKDEEDDDE